MPPAAARPPCFCCPIHPILLPASGRETILGSGVWREVRGEYECSSMTSNTVHSGGVYIRWGVKRLTPNPPSDLHRPMPNNRRASLGLSAAGKEQFGLRAAWLARGYTVDERRRGVSSGGQYTHMGAAAAGAVGRTAHPRRSARMVHPQGTPAVILLGMLLGQMVIGVHAEVGRRAAPRRDGHTGSGSGGDVSGDGDDAFERCAWTRYPPTRAQLCSPMPRKRFSWAGQRPKSGTRGECGGMGAGV